ncbi:phosphoribosylformylglycinamidine synthase subunit PurS [Cryobacterium sp. Y29]|uniref:phosphoribosylformylglycinamidine synthase subunit PurS n=1 Tax=Cryobacterium sp. Y29 TaxID=2048285 RepID=UPI000CE56DCC|nr:phosphoribosylformylglycinamidine synthase subunit PurS [Cryobacterium sp. Y29]
MPTIVVDVMPKAELLDPQGKAIAGALGRLGQTQTALANISGVRVGKRFEISIDGAADADVLAAVRVLADSVLSNSVIEDVVGIHVQDAPSSAVA